MLTSLDKCLKCGSCCYCRISVGDEAVETGIKCMYLINNLCSIYETRDKWKPEWCKTANEMIDEDLIKHLPDTCGYKQGG